MTQNDEPEDWIITSTPEKDDIFTYAKNSSLSSAINPLVYFSIQTQRGSRYWVLAEKENNIGFDVRSSLLLGASKLQPEDTNVVSDSQINVKTLDPDSPPSQLFVFTYLGSAQIDTASVEE